MRRYVAFSLFVTTSLLATGDLSESDCGMTPSPYRATTRHIEGKGIGYTQGYTTVELFATPAPMLKTSWIPFIDGRVHIFNNGHIATNIGLGLRYLLPSYVLGLSSYYDYRETSHQKYNQYNLNLEALGKVFDFRLNGYLPVGTKKSPFYNTQFGYFQGHSLFLSHQREFAMKGWNAEVGVHIKKMKNMSFYGAFGPYYFEKMGQNAIGGKMRLSGTFLNHIQLEVSGSYDPIFHGIGQGELSFIFPFGPKARVLSQGRACSLQKRLYERALQPVDKQEIVVVSDQVTYPLATNPLTAQPYRCVFIDNRSHSLGTFESPYATLEDAEVHSSPHDLLYVFTGDGTSKGMNQGITLKNHQKLLGSSTSHSITTQLGTVVIPPSTHNLPQLSNTQDAVVTLSHGCEVAGLSIQAGAGYGILGGDPVDGTAFVMNAWVRDNIVLASTSEHMGIGLAVCGKAAVLSNRVEVGDHATAIKIFNPEGQTLLPHIIGNHTVSGHTTNSSGIYTYGIFVHNEGRMEHLLIAHNNVVAGNAQDPSIHDVVGILIHNTSSTIAPSIRENVAVVGRYGKAIRISNHGMMTQPSITLNDVHAGYGGKGIYVSSQTHGLHPVTLNQATIFGNTISCTTYGIGIWLLNSGNEVATPQTINHISLSSNKIRVGDHSNGIQLSNWSSQATSEIMTNQAHIVHNTIEAKDGANGIFLHNRGCDGSGRLIMNETRISNNHITVGSNSYGIDLFNDGSGTPLFPFMHQTLLQNNELKASSSSHGINAENRRGHLSLKLIDNHPHISIPSSRVPTHLVNTAGTFSLDAPSGNIPIPITRNVTDPIMTREEAPKPYIPLLKPARALHYTTKIEPFNTP